MTTYDDAKLNGFIGRITLISDPSVPTLSCIIEADTADGRTLTQNQHMTAADFAYDRAGVSQLVRRIGVEEDVPMAAFDRLEVFVGRWPAASIDEVIDAFAMIAPKRQAA
jgi:hypothetical protein